MSAESINQPLSPLGRPSRIMIVDDSAFIRGLVARWLTEAGGFEIVATASNGRMAIDVAERTKPEIILLDIEMPEVDGLAALPRILKVSPGSKVIVISTLTQRSAEISLKCLSLGAVDYLAKPESSRAAGSATDFRRDLVEKLRALGVAKAHRPRRIPAPAPVARALPKPASARPQCLLIGASTGGPRAVERVLLDLKPVLPRIPVLIVQHMPPMFTAVFAEHLRSLLSIPTREAKDGEDIMPGNILIAPGGRHMGVASTGRKAIIRLNDDPPESFCRPAVDVLFREAAAVYGSSAIAAVLTGMGSDGTQGARHLTNAGCMVIAQDEATSIVWGMPGSIAKAGLAHEVLPLEAIGRALKNHITGSSE